MHLSTITLLAGLASVGLAAPSTTGVYYAFYDDYECEGNQITKTHFDSDNTGCFNLNGGKCMQAKGGQGVLEIPCLVAYSSPDCQDAQELGCNCLAQDEYPGTVHFNLAKWQFAQNASSFKFVKDCPTACAGECPGGHPPTVKRDSKPKSHDYAWYDSDDCSGEAGAGIEPSSTGSCQKQAKRRSIYNNNDAAVSFAGFRTQDQSCPTDNRFSTFTVQGKSCATVKNFDEGGANSYLQIAFGVS